MTVMSFLAKPKPDMRTMMSKSSRVLLDYNTWGKNVIVLDLLKPGFLLKSEKIKEKPFNNCTTYMKLTRNYLLNDDLKVSQQQMQSKPVWVGLVLTFGTYQPYPPDIGSKTHGHEV